MSQSMHLYQLPLAALGVMLLPSCSAQPGSKAPVVITHDMVPIPNEWFVDLYHEGQLCHWVRSRVPIGYERCHR